MAKPRVFVSSTYYDLRHVRELVGRFISDQGFEPVLFERGEVAYGSKESPQEYCYTEIESCDILVSIVGGKFGSPSSSKNYSITQKELRHALGHGKQVYIFIEKNVRAEYETYLVNKSTTEIRYKHVDDRRVYEFIEELFALPKNNPIFSFESPQDILAILKEQWAGLFQRLLQQQADREQADVLSDLKNAASTLQQLVTVLVAQAGIREQAIESILFFNHPAFVQTQKLLQVPYRVVFTNRDELTTWLKARSYSLVREDLRDEPDTMEYVRTRDGTQYLFKVRQNLFEESGRLLPASTTEPWDETAIRLEVSEMLPDYPLDFETTSVGETR